MRSITSVIGRMARRRFKISVRVRFCKRDKRGVWSAWLSLVSEGVVRGGGAGLTMRVFAARTDCRYTSSVYAVK
jgi:hypothetical protein